MSKIKQLSIIVPVYNVEKYIFKCIDSLYHQGLSDDSYEIIVVNDGTEDNSMDFISTFISQHANIIVLNQANRGLSAARNNGLAHANGIYVMFVDSDDCLIPNSLSILLPKAIASSVDMLIADYIKMPDGNIESAKAVQDSFRNEEIIMKGREPFLKFLNPTQCYVWRTIYRREFLEKNHITFIPNIYFEDIPFTMECYLKVENTLLFLFPFYIYRQHNNSIVSSVDKKKLLDINIIIAHLCDMLNTEVLSKDEYTKLKDSIFSTFSIEMWFLSHTKEVYKYRNEIISDLKQRVSDLQFMNGYKQRLISFLFKWMPYTYLWIRSLNII